MAKTPASTRPNAASTFSMLGADTVITGNIEASADLHVDGRIDGDIACNALVQGEDSRITGSIRAETVRVAGSVSGTIAARDVVILKTARIEGDVSYDTLTIEQGARLDGRLSPHGGQMPPAITQSAKPAEAELVLTPTK
ncbi:bactofilin family protein [Novosphingobium mangrovi (ex Huang et al. 2023)]|uniref:Polymer-forming cytoskeletal protein n=1 Tax=Novosphingobium mangrovi (ex Huang et al. 2023) TaxID=2976432 RepID=A0ABT2I8U8_9SPHN|nr:polymer-forming cytoskeletal protein [Novosphingobium mangrovi (ex Huang et al. 2023)]MCT2401244.1 polymer-forming cytoskeletal protein [Novosphingobium mangrovi (ex Huang et al. 2023)]